MVIGYDMIYYRLNNICNIWKKNTPFQNQTDYKTQLYIIQIMYTSISYELSIDFHLMTGYHLHIISDVKIINLWYLIKYHLFIMLIITVV